MHGANRAADGAGPAEYAAAHGAQDVAQLAEVLQLLAAGTECAVIKHYIFIVPFGGIALKRQAEVVTFPASADVGRFFQAKLQHT